MMGRHLLLLALLLSLPLTVAWTAFNCLVSEGSRLPLASRFFGICPIDSSLPLLAWCSSVTNLTQALEAVPRGVEGLCLTGSISVLPPDAFSHFPGLKLLGLSLRLTQLLPGAFQGLGQLRQLSFLSSQMDYLYLTPDAFGSLSSLHHLSFWHLCLEGSIGVRLPPSLQWLSIQHSCLQNVSMLANIFPDLVLGASSGNGWTLDMLGLSFNKKLNLASPGALQGLKLGTLRMDHTNVEASEVVGLGLQRLDILSVERTATATLPTKVIAYFELQELNMVLTQIRHITPEALASCHSLKSLVLNNGGLTDLPLVFLSAMPRLQRLSLRSNKLQSAMLCTNEMGAKSGLQALDLSENRLHTLPPATFSCLPHLWELLLWKNQLVSLESQVFNGLRHLEILDLSMNPLVALGNDWLAPLPALTTLNLLDTQMVLGPTWDFWGRENLQNLGLKFPSGPSGLVLSLPMSLTSLELQAVTDMAPWKLAPNVFPVLQSLTLKGWGLQLGAQNVSKIFPALHQLSLLGNSFEALCSQNQTSSFFLWQLPRLEQLSVIWNGRSPWPCCIRGLPSLRVLKLQALQSKIQPRPVLLEELVGELPRLEGLQLSNTGLETLSAVAFQGLGSLQVLVLDMENGLVLDSSLQEYSPQMPQYMYFLSVSLACQCANAWVGTWLEWAPRTYMYIVSHQLCKPEGGTHAKNLLFPFLWSHCPKTLELELFLGSSALLLLLISLPFLQEARNSWILYLQALFRACLQGLKGRKGEGKKFLYDVFVSHCRQDQGWVVWELLPALEGSCPAGRGLRLCLPERDFEPGKDVADNVVDSMASSRVMLCVLSHQALQNPRCRLELYLATCLLLAGPQPPVLLLVFLEPVSCHQLPRYHRLARLLRRGDYRVWPKEGERKDYFWAWLWSRLKQCVGYGSVGACVMEVGGRKNKQTGRR